MSTDVTAGVIEIIAKSKSLDPATLTPATTFEELNIDSLDKINLSFEIEERFAVEIPDNAMDSLRSVADVIAGVERLQAARQ